MLAAVTVVALPSGRPGALVAEPDAVAKSLSGLTLGAINQMYEDGQPSNDPAEAGLVVHSHDNTEPDMLRGSSSTSPVYRPGDEFQEYWATSIVNRRAPGLYNDDCGIILNPAAVSVLCSYYTDIVSWSEGCDKHGLYNMVGGLGVDARDTPYEPEELKDMLEVSVGIQTDSYNRHNATSEEKRLRAAGVPPGDGEPGGGGAYNEVLIDSQVYLEQLPTAVVGVFYVEGGNPDGKECAQRTHDAIVDEFGVKEDDVLLLTHVPGATPAFVKFKPSAEDKARIEAALDDEGSEQAQGQQGAGGGLHDCKATSPTVTDEWCENSCSLGATACQPTLCECHK